MTLEYQRRALAQCLHPSYELPELVLGQLVSVKLYTEPVTNLGTEDLDPLLQGLYNYGVGTGQVARVVVAYG